MRITFPKNLSVRSLPVAQKLLFQKTASYSFSTESAPNSITFRRDLVVGNGIYPVADYPELRKFFQQLETKDHEVVAF